MTESTGDPVEHALVWLRAHEFPGVGRVAPGSSVLVDDALRGRVWATLPAEDELRDLLETTPEGSWCVAILRREPDASLTTGELAVQVAALVHEGDGSVRAANERGHQLVEWIGARQRAQSFAARALHVLADERPEAAEALRASAADPPPEPEPQLPTRSTRGVGIHETPTTPLLAVRAAIEDPEPEPTAEELAAADADKQRRIEDMRRQRELRKSVKHR